MAEKFRDRFKRYAYSPRNRIVGESPEDFDKSNTGIVFTGADLQAYINNIRVGNLEQVTWSVSVEVMGNYVMGRRDAVVYTTGKRVVVGSLVFSQYDRHALIEQVFGIKPGAILGDLWDESGEGYSLVQDRATVTTTTPLGYGGSYGNAIEFNESITNDTYTLSGVRGLSTVEFNRQLKEKLRDTARLVAAQKFNYSDQIPPFDLTLVGVTKAGDAARMSIFGLQITQETAGFSQQDLGNAVGMSFVALGVSPWRAVDVASGVAQIPGI